MLLLIDNYDSFTYNLYQELARLGQDVLVMRHDAITLEQAIQLKPQRVMVSPGPGTPDDSGISMEVISYFSGRIPVLGVCLGHQCLAQCFGGKVIRAQRIVHGKTSWMHHNSAGVFANLPNPFEATRYHSLLVEKATLPDTFEVTSWTDQDEIMGLRHIPTGAEGVQFHPESILTVCGPQLLENFATC